jgi:hypothetical protein
MLQRESSDKNPCAVLGGHNQQVNLAALYSQTKQNANDFVSLTASRTASKGVVKE